jgi:YD repeat-containing protein
MRGEPGVSGVTVTLYDANGNVLATTTTDASGAYSFTNLPPDTYQVGFTLPVGYDFTGTNLGGDDTLDSDADPITGLTQQVTLVAGENNPTLDAGLTPIPASLGNYVWYDTNGDGIQDATETGVDGVTVTLYDGNGNVVATTTTDASLRIYWFNTRRTLPSVSATYQAATN